MHLPTSCLLFLFCNPLIPISAVCMHLRAGVLHWSVTNLPWPPHWRKLTPLPGLWTLLIAPQLVWSCLVPFPLLVGVSTDFILCVPVSASRPAVGLCVQWLCQEQKTLFSSNHPWPLALTVFPLASSLVVPEAWRAGMWDSLSWSGSYYIECAYLLRVHLSAREHISHRFVIIQYKFWRYNLDLI